MCAIVDANVAHEVFGECRSEAGERFFRRLNSGSLRLVVGGKLLDELDGAKAREWIRQAILGGRVRQELKSEVDCKEEVLRKSGEHGSDDAHIIALAQVSGARLLYSNDRDLHRDFGDKRLIDRPRGKVYSTRGGESFTKVHARLLKDRSVCRVRCRGRAGSR